MNTAAAGKRRRPTIADVAAAADVSIKTVSRMLNGSDSVSPETAARIRSAVDRLGFRANSAARELAGHSSRTVGVVIPLAPDRVFSHWFFFEVLHGISEALTRNGYQLVLYVQPEPSQFIDLWRTGQTDGLVLMSLPAEDDRIRQMRDEGVPFVLTSRPGDPGGELDASVSWVDVDHRRGARSALDHLIGLGHTRLGYVGGPPWLMSSRLRKEGMREAIAAHGMDPDAVPSVEAEFTVEEGRVMGARLLRSATRPTAIFCCDDTLALGVMDAAREQGLSIPDDLSVVGFDDIEISRLAIPPMTTVRQPPRLKGRLAAASVMRQILGDIERDHPEQHLLETELIVRKSTAAVERDSSKE